MKWPWTRHAPDPIRELDLEPLPGPSQDAADDVVAAEVEQRLRESRTQRREAEAVSDGLRRWREANHFSQKIQAAGWGQR